MKYTIYIQPGISLHFMTKTDVKNYIRTHKRAAYYNVLMLDNLFNQISELKRYVGPRFNTQDKMKFQDSETRYLEQSLQIYVNNGGMNHAYVQFNKIRVCFDLTLNYTNDLLHWANTHKDVTLRLRLRVIKKFYYILLETYTRDTIRLKNIRVKDVQVKKLDNEKYTNRDSLHKKKIN